MFQILICFLNRPFPPAHAAANFSSSYLPPEKYRVGFESVQDLKLAKFLLGSYLILQAVECTSLLRCASIGRIRSDSFPTGSFRISQLNTWPPQRFSFV